MLGRRTKSVFEPGRRIWNSVFSENCRRGVGSTKIVVWRAPGDAGSTKIVFWRSPGAAGSTKVVVWRAPGAVGSTKIVVWRVLAGVQPPPRRTATARRRPLENSFLIGFMVIRILEQ